MNMQINIFTIPDGDSGSALQEMNQMGDVFGNGEANEKPVHEVELNSFYIGKYPVTQGWWQEIMGRNSSRFRKGDDYPVESVNYHDVQQFINKLNRLTGKQYRLPTEAEWEYAARSGGKKEKWAGTNNVLELHEYAWFAQNSDNSTQPVGWKLPNGLGIYDMSGNVWEWCSDWYVNNYYQNPLRHNPSGPLSGMYHYRVTRGGGWGTSQSARYLSYSTSRHNESPDSAISYLGFRLVLPVQQ